MGIPNKGNSCKEAARNPLGVLLSIELSIMAALFCAIVLPKFFAIAPDLALSGSMNESAPVGSIAYLDTRASPENLQAGDIAAYQATSDTAVLHRIYAINEDGTFTFKGDANSVCDAARPSSDEILGKYMFCIPFAGYVYIWIAEHAALVIALVLAANLIAYAAGRTPQSPRNKACGLANKTPVETKG